MNGALNLRILFSKNEAGYSKRIKKNNLKNNKLEMKFIDFTDGSAQSYIDCRYYVSNIWPFHQNIRITQPNVQFIIGEEIQNQIFQNNDPHIYGKN